MNRLLAQLASLRVIAPAFVILAALLVAGLGAGLTVRERREAVAAEADVRIRFEGAGLMRDAERFLYLRPALVREELGFVTADPVFRAAAIFDDQGRCVFAHQPEWMGRPMGELLDPADAALLGELQGERRARVIQRDGPPLELVYIAGFRIPPAPGELRSQRRGSVYLRLQPETPSLLTTVLPTTVPVSMALLALALLALAYIQRRVVRPLRQLGDASRLIGSGALPTVDTTRGPPEVRRVAEALAAMGERVRETIDESIKRREFMRAVLDALHEGVVVADETGRVVLANAAARSLFGERCDPLHNGHIDRLFADEALAELNRSGDAVACRALHAAGDPFWAEVQSMPFESFDGLVQVLVIRDVTEDRRIDDELEAHRNRLEELVDSRTRDLEEARSAAERASQAKSDFLAALSHEIRTPLNGVVSMVELLSHTRMDAEQVDMVRVVQDSSATLLGLVTDMLDFARIEAGRLELVSEPMCIEQEATRTARNLDVLARERRVELQLRVADGLPQRVLGDAQRLRQVLGNLLANAIKFSSGLDYQGRVLLTARCLSAGAGTVKVEFSVRDNGIGMREEDQARIFAPFEQAGEDIARRFGGTGLGLAIVRRLTDAMQGEIELHSSPGLGSVFTLRVDFPVLAFEAAGTPPLQNVHCALMGMPGGEIEDWARCLRRAGAVVERPYDLDGLREYAMENRSGSLVWLVQCSAADEALLDALMELRSSAGAPPLLLLDARPEASVSASVAGTRVLGTRLLSSATLVEAVTELAGRPTAEAMATAAASTAVLSTPALAHEIPRIMVVDDNATNRLVVERQLAALGHRMQSLETAQAALSLLENENFDLILTDLQMPGIDGLEFVARIRDMEAALGRRRTPVVALTANALERERRRCLAAGMDDYLTKPVTLERLRLTLQRWLSVEADTPLDSAEALDLQPDVLATLRSFLGNDPQVLQDYLQVFAAELDAYPAALADALERDAASRIAVLAHQVKSSARSVGSRELADACEALERIAQAGTRQSIKLHIRMVNAEIRRTSVHLANALQALTDTRDAEGRVATRPVDSIGSA
jgi:PAS domain S-box-containing protein